MAMAWNGEFLGGFNETSQGEWSPPSVAGTGVPEAGFSRGEDGCNGEAELSCDDPVEQYFACITTCSLDDGACITICTDQLRESH